MVKTEIIKEKWKQIKICNKNEQQKIKIVKNAEKMRLWIVLHKKWQEKGETSENNQ